MADSGSEPVRLPGNVEEPVDPSAYLELNRAWWDERVPHHVSSSMYDDAAFRAGGDTLQPWEPDLLGNVAGKRLVHLQCHFGHDTMSWARRGASVVGLDFSPTAVEVANGLAADLGLDARFVCSDVYEAEAALGERFDVVYTGFGAINWLPDLDRWARVVASLLRPGGRLLLAEFHPFSWVFGDDDLTVEHDYFETLPFAWDETGSYADQEATTVHNRTIEQQHTLDAVFGAILRAGLRIEAYREFDHTLFPRWSNLVLQDDGTYRLPDGAPRLPLMFALVADAPEPETA